MQYVICPSGKKIVKAWTPVAITVTQDVANKPYIKCQSTEQKYYDDFFDNYDEAFYYIKDEIANHRALLDIGWFGKNPNCPPMHMSKDMWLKLIKTPTQCKLHKQKGLDYKNPNEVDPWVAYFNYVLVGHHCNDKPNTPLTYIGFRVEQVEIHVSDEQDKYVNSKYVQHLKNIKNNKQK